MSSELPVTGAIAQRATKAPLTSEDFRRYPRQIVLDQVGEAGQRQLKAARILVVGAGGLGSPCLLYLAGAGVGTIGIADFDQVEVSNLQRQILFAADQTGHSKATMAQTRLQALNPLVQGVTHLERVTAANVKSILQDYDIVIDGSDNFATRYLVNDAAIDLHKPYIYGSVQRFSGQVGVFYPPHGPCYRCLFPHPPSPSLIPNCSESGVLGSLAGTIGTLQATEALKLVLGVGKSLLGRILAYDGLRGEFTSYHLGPDPTCVGCGSGERTQRSMPEVAPALTCSTPSVDFPQVTSSDLKIQVAAGRLPLALIDVRNTEETTKQGIVDLDGAPNLEIPLGVLETYLEFQSGGRGGLDAPAKELVEKALRLIAAATPRNPVILYCKTGPRSQRAWGIFSQLVKGETSGKLQLLQGGHMGWLADLAKPL